MYTDWPFYFCYSVLNINLFSLYLFKTFYANKCFQCEKAVVQFFAFSIFNLPLQRQNHKAIKGRPLFVAAQWAKILICTMYVEQAIAQNVAFSCPAPNLHNADIDDRYICTGSKK
jgi:hypothetical protein